MDIWSSQYGVMMETVARSGVAMQDIVAIGITKGRDVLFDAVNAVVHGISEEKRNVLMDRAIYAQPEETDEEE